MEKLRKAALRRLEESQPFSVCIVAIAHMKSRSDKDVV